MISKKKLLSLIESNLNEMPVDYGGTQDRMNPEIERNLANKETPFKDNKGIPDEEPEGITSNFEELLASKRFLDVVRKVKHYTGFQGNLNPQNTLTSLHGMMIQTMHSVLAFEQQHKEELERMAVELITKEMKVPENTLNFDVNLVQPGEIPNEGFNQNEQNPTEDDVEQEFGVDGEEAAQDLENFMTSMEKFNDEVAKRRILNALIQGASQKGYYMFELVAERLNQMSPNIVRQYGILMSINDLLYWMMPSEMINMMSDMKAGREEVVKGNQGGEEDGDDQEQPQQNDEPDNDMDYEDGDDQEQQKPTVRVHGVFFPVLLHELIKGVMETLASQGLPDSKEAADMVMNKSDTLPNEMWDLRLGPIIWEKLLETYPERIFEEDAKHIQHYLFSRFSKLSTDEFFRICKLIIKGDPLGKQIVERMVGEIEESLRNEEWEQEEYRMDNSDDDIDNDGDSDGLQDFLGGLGIDLPRN